MKYLTILLFILVLICLISYFYYRKSIDPVNLTYLKNFITQEECDYLINLSRDKFQISKVVIGTDITKTDTNNRTSYSCYLDDNDNVVKQIKERVSNLLGKNSDCIESLQVVRYFPGQEFKEHHDWFQKDYTSKINNQRQYTIFCYLNDVIKGGETCFPKLNKEFKPKKGCGLLWTNCKSQDVCYDTNLHQGKPPIEGIKYGLNIWVRFSKFV